MLDSRIGQVGGLNKLKRILHEKEVPMQVTTSVLLFCSAFVSLRVFVQ